MGKIGAFIWSLLLLIITSAFFPLNYLQADPAYLSTKNDTNSFIHPLDSLEPKMNNAYLDGFEAYNKGDFIKADSFWTISLNIRKDLFSETDPRVAVNLINLGAANLNLWNHELILKSVCRKA